MGIHIDGDGPVLMVDDQEDDILIAKTCYARSRLTNPFVALNGGAELLEYMGAVEVGRSEMPALVLLDINMPEMDGFEILTWLRSREPFRDLPTVSMLTNSDSPRDIERSRRLGADAFLTKPIRIREYVAFFDSLLPPGGEGGAGH